MVGVYQHNLDFEILETGNPKTLVFIDSSEYMEDPEKPLLEITPPGYSKYFLVPVEARQVNTFNSSTIGINEVFEEICLIDLPDGLWKLKYKICPYTHIYVCKYVMRVSLLLRRLKELYKQLDLLKEDINIDTTITRINILIKGAILGANDDPDKAVDYYKQASKLIEKELDKFCKLCK